MRPAENHPALRLIAKPRPDWWTLRFDGSCEGNGRPDATGSWGFSLECNLGVVIAEGSGESLLTPTTSNRCEWEGLIAGLLATTWQRTATPAGILIEGDSKLVVCCLNGEFKAKDEVLRRLRDRARSILGRYGVRWCSTWIPRERNGHCDRLAASVQ